jgi:hypothetical protein
VVKEKPASPVRRKSGRQSSRTPEKDESGAGVDLNAIVGALKEWDKFEAVEERILDKSSQVDRTLLVMYAAQRLSGIETGLTSGEISTVTKGLGVPLSVPNVSRTLSGAAHRYVHGDAVRKKGAISRYQLTRRGLQYIEAVIDGTEDADKE